MDVVTSHEAVRMLNRNRTTLHHYEAKGLLHKVGVRMRQSLYPRREIEAILAARIAPMEDK
jgi:DNA-binding transcriptional MerR regulator